MILSALLTACDHGPVEPLSAPVQQQPEPSYSTGSSNYDASRDKSGMSFIPPRRFVYDPEFFWKSSPCSADDTCLRILDMHGYYLDQHEVSRADYALFVSANALQDKTFLVTKTCTGTIEVTAKNENEALAKVDLSGLASECRAEAKTLEEIKMPGVPLQVGPYREDQPQLPIIDVSQDMAAAYCQWRKKRLPTPEEWINAAQGPSGRDKYAIPEALLQRFNECRKKEEEAGYFGEDPLRCFGRFAYSNIVFAEHLVEVDDPLFFPNGFGLYHMSGNAWEWTSKIDILAGMDYTSSDRDGFSETYRTVNVLFDPPARFIFEQEEARRMGTSERGVDPLVHGFRCAADENYTPI